MCGQHAGRVLLWTSLWRYLCDDHAAISAAAGPCTKGRCPRSLGHLRSQLADTSQGWTQTESSTDACGSPVLSLHT